MADTFKPFRCKVMHSGKKAILMLPDRKKRPDLPYGEAPVMVNGIPAVAVFAKIAVNVMKRENKNVLTELLQSFFGETAGMSGTKFYVEFVAIGDALHMRPVYPEQDTIAA